WPTHRVPSPSTAVLRSSTHRSTPARAPSPSTCRARSRCWRGQQSPSRAASPGRPDNRKRVSLVCTEGARAYLDVDTARWRRRRRRATATARGVGAPQDGGRSRG
ncbi:hypothetical protein OH76DRAFT_1562353, partial [Lentinus brumalis]